MRISVFGLGDLNPVDSPFTGIAIIGAAAGDQLGYNAVATGDFNGNGLDDLAESRHLAIDTCPPGVFIGDQLLGAGAAVLAAVV